MLVDVARRARRVHTDGNRAAMVQFHTNLLSRAVVSVAGRDARKFLQGMISNDINRAANAPIYSGLFNHKGRYMFDAFIVRDENASNDADENFLLDVSVSAVADIMTHLTKHKLRSKVAISNVSSKAKVVSFVSPDRYTLTNIMMRIEDDNGIAFSDPRLPSLGVRAIISRDVRYADTFGVANESEGLYEAWLMANGVPTHGRELIPGKTIALEANFDWLNGISFTKGCYLGQELIARTHFTGTVRKRIVPVYLAELDADRLLTNPLFAPAAFDLNFPSVVIQSEEQPAIVMGQVKIGSLLSVRGNVGLALLRLQHLFHPTDIAQCERYQVRPHVPAWWMHSERPL